MPSSLRLDLEVLLPDIADERDACVARLTDELAELDGIAKAHLAPADPDSPAQLCLHYDPDNLSVARVRRAALRAGATISNRYGHALWHTSGVAHSRRARTVARQLRRQAGVLEAEVSASGPLRIEYDREETSEPVLRQLLTKLGVDVIDEPGQGVPTVQRKGDGVAAANAIESHEHAHGGLFGERSELIFALASGACVGLGWGLGLFTDGSPGTQVALFIAGYFFGGWFTVREAWSAIRTGKFEIDFLMLVAAAGAAVLGEWFEGALLLFLFSIGHALEGFAMGRARRAIEGLTELAPKTATVRRDGAELEVPVDSLTVGDTVIVRPNERLPADGFVVSGTSAVNQARVTGESVPVDKQPVADRDATLSGTLALEPVHQVFAGTINGSGALEVVVTKTSSEFTLARVARLVAEAQTERSPTQRFTDRFERVFVPSVLALVGLLLLAPLVLDEPFTRSFYRAMAVLVAASPCALAIATPSAVLSGVARAGRGGVRVKGGGPPEALGSLTAIAFDKTGTLTEGNPRVTDVVSSEGATEQELLEVAVAIERLSDHPLAKAVVNHAEGKELSRVDATDLESVTGRGVRATVDGVAAHLGKDDLFAEVSGPPLPDSLRRTIERLESEGRTTMVVRLGDRYLGVIGLMDTPREVARSTISRLRDIGIRRVLMVSGDNQRVADAVAEAVGLDEAYGDLMPDDKVTVIRRLAQKSQVAMVGDGVNDAPAMAKATVGIAMGAAGSDVALETADVALMADELSHLPFAVGLSRKTRRIIQQNLWLSLGMVGFLVPATIVGLGIGPAVALHEGSTLVVVFNALRLLAFRESGANRS